MLEHGLYEQVINNQLNRELSDIPEARKAIAPIDKAEASKVLSQYLADIVQKGLDSSLTLLRIAFQHVRQMGTISEEDLDFLVLNNAIIPSTRTEILREGLCLALNGKLYTAMHILLPQTEHIFRNLVKMCGDTVTFLNSDGSEEYKPLSVLFKSEKLLNFYNGDIIFTFQSIMDDRAGENLRNLNGHGIIDPETGSEITFLHFLSLLIKLLSLYSFKLLPSFKN